MNSQKFIPALLGLFLLTACSKIPVTEPPVSVPVPLMEYTDLSNRVVRYGQPPVVMDVDRDGTPDLRVGVILVGDAVRKEDRREFRLTSGIYSRLAVNQQEAVPRMSSGNVIPVHDFNGYSWWLVSSCVLMQRVENTAGIIRWEGNWAGAVRQYVPFQLYKNGSIYTGWLEMSADTAGEAVTLHRLAVCRESGRAITAGN
jgi:hypothetical protein